MGKIKLYLNNKGNAYIYVTIVMMSLFLMLRISINITTQSILISEAAYKSSNLYSMSRGGIDKGIYALNNIILTNKHNINNNVLYEIQNMNYKDMVIFITEENNYYRGSFNLKYEYQLYESLFKYYSREYINNYLLEIEGKINYVFDNYNVEIIISSNPIISNNYLITSVATDNNSNVSLTLEAIVSFVGEVYNEKIIENYKWHDMPIYFANVVNEYTNFYEIFNLQINLKENNWSYEYPILFNTNDTLTVDISNFYKDLYPTNTIIIHSGQGDLFIYKSEETKNEFNGIIISLGNIIFDERAYVIEGSLVSGGFIKYYDLDMINNSDILFNINFNYIEDERKLYEALYLTNFLRGDGYPLERIDICNKSALEININDPITLIPIYITQVN